MENETFVHDFAFDRIGLSIKDNLEMTKKVDHIAIAVSSLEKGLSFYHDLLGLEHCGTEEIPEQKVKTAMLAAGSTHLELLEPTSNDSPVAKYIGQRGEGLHHIAFQVEDLEGELVRLKTAGARLIHEKPTRGVGGTRIAFVHPASAAGVLLELVERP